MTTLQALKILKNEFEALNIPQNDGSFMSLMQLEDVLIQIVKELKPEVRRFVDAQKRKKVETVESFHKKKLLYERKKQNTPSKNLKP